MKNKICATFAEAVQDIPDGASIMMHSFTGSAGIAQNLIVALKDRAAKDLTVIACSMGVTAGAYLNRPGFKPFVAPSFLVEAKLVKRVISSWQWGTCLVDKLTS